MGNIVWLAAYPKSGNTWLRAFLANLVANRDAPVSLAELPNFAADDANPDLFSALAGRPSCELAMDEIAELRPKVHAEIARRAHGTRFVKTHNIFGSFHGHPLHNLSVTAGAIYVVRNPLDVVVSMTHHFGIELNEAIEWLGDERVAIPNDTLFVSQILGSWSLHVQSWTGVRRNRLLVLRYEDLISRPSTAFAKVAKLVGMGQDRVRVANAIRQSSFSVLAAMEKRHGFVEAPGRDTRFFRSGRTNAWREALTRKQVCRVIADHYDQMRRFGYLPAGHR